MSDFIVVCDSTSKNTCKTIESNNITTASIIESLNLTDSVLFIVTPSYQLLLNPDQCPVEEYPELIQKTPLRPHKRPKFYLEIKDAKSKFEEATIFIYLRFSFPIPPVAFPVSFNFTEMDSSKTLFSFFQYQLPFEYKSAELIVNNNQRFEDCSMDDLIDFLRYNTLACKIQFYDSSTFLKQLEDRASLIKSFFDKEYQFIKSISQLAFFWQPLLIKEQLIDKDDAYYIFSTFNSTVTAHNMFLLEFQQKMNEDQNVLDIFCDFNYFFDRTENLFRGYSTFDCYFKNKMKYFDFQTKLDNILKTSNIKNREPFFELFFLPVSRLKEIQEFLLKLASLTPSFYSDQLYVEQAKTVCKSSLDELKAFLTVQPSIFMELVDLEDRIINRSQFDILSPSRSLLSCFKGKIDHCASNHGYIYIFNDVVLITKVARKGEMGKYIEYCLNFRYLTGKNTLYIFKNDREFIQFTFLDENNYEFAIQQIIDQKTLYYSKLNKLDDLLIWNCVDSTYSLQLNACSCGVVVNNFMYLIGGYRGQKFANHVSVYDIKNNTLKTIFNPLPGRKYHSATEMNDVIYIFGGIDSNHTILGDFVTLYTNSSDYSMQKRFGQNPPCPRYGQSLVSDLNSQLFMFGGINRDKKFLGDFHMCVCIQNAFFSWKRIEAPNSPCPRAFHSSVIMSGRYMIIYGGIYEKKVLDDITIFDTENKKWITPILNGDSIVPRFMHKAVMYSNWMIVIGGNSSDSSEPLHPFGIMFEIDKEEKFVGTVVNFTSGGNDRPNLSNFSIAVYNQEIIIVGGYNNLPENTSQGIFKINLPKKVINSAHQQKKLKRKQTAPAKLSTPKLSEPKYIAKTILPDSKTDKDSNKSKNPFLTKSYYLQFQNQKKTENNPDLNINENDQNNLKNFDSLNEIQIDIPMNFSKITPKQRPSSYTKPFIMLDNLFPITDAANKKKGVYTFPLEDEVTMIKTTKNILEKKKEEPSPPQLEMGSPIEPPKLGSDDDDDNENNATTKNEMNQSLTNQSSLMAMMPPKLDSFYNDNDSDSDL